jgi:hypothetical protein
MAASVLRGEIEGMSESDLSELCSVIRALKAVKTHGFGLVSLSVHQGVVSQIETTIRERPVKDAR